MNNMVAAAATKLAVVKKENKRIKDNKSSDKSSYQRPITHLQ